MYKHTAVLKLKHNNSFNLLCNYTDDEGNNLSLTGLDISADIKNNDKEYVCSLVVNITDTNKGLFQLSLEPNMELPYRDLYLDVRISENSTVRNSDILKLEISEVVTYG